MRFALSSEPHPLSNEDRQRLTWEAATERFLDVSELRPEERAGPVDTVIESAAYSLVKALNGVTLPPAREWTFETLLSLSLGFTAHCRKKLLPNQVH